MKTPAPANWPQLSLLLDELLDLPEPARQARLAALQAEHPELADELAALLASDGQARSGGFLGGAMTPPSAALAEAANLAGQRLGPYVLEAPIGQGGGGSVWRARREDGRYDAAVAVKLLHLALLGHAGAQRFVREGQILGRLTHPHIAHLLDAGVTPTGQPYLVLELVQGERIDQHCDARGLGIEQRLALFGDVLTAVAHAHAHGVIHRDLKPANVLVSAEGSVKLLDFGIAKLLADEADLAEVSELTRDGGRVLTPEYAAPEQLRGEGVTTATDVYALGVMLYQLLTGQHATTPAGSTSAQAMQATLEVDAPRASRAAGQATDGVAAGRRGLSPQRLSRRLRGDLDNIVARCLRKAPGERYATVTALADDLRRHLAHEPVSARADSFSYVAARFMRRHRAAVAGAVLTTLALLAGTAVATWQMFEAREQREEARAQAARSAATEDFLTVMVSEVGADGGAQTPRQMLDRGLSLLDSSAVTEPRFLVAQLLLLGMAYENIGQADRQGDLLARAESVAREAGLEDGLIEVLCSRINVDLMAGHRDKAQARLGEAQQMLALQPSPLPELQARCLAAGADMAATDNRLTEAVALAQQALAHLKANGLGRHSLVGATLSQLAEYHNQLGDARKGFVYNRQSLDAYVQRGHGGTMQAMVMRLNETGSLYSFGELKLALELGNQLMAMLAARGTQDADSAPFMVNHGSLLVAFGQDDQALAVVERALTAATATGNLFWQYRAMYVRAQALVHLGRSDAALKALDEVEAAYRTDPVLYMPYLNSVALVRAEWMWRSGDVGGARRLVDGLIRDMNPEGVTPSAALRRALPLAAELALAQSDPSAALSLAEAAVKATTAATDEPTRSAHVGQSKLLLARAQYELGRQDQALENLSAGITALRNGLSEEHVQVASAQTLLAAWKPPGPAAKQGR
jgi:serine/threonine protein kinase/tetratricopeptide (TPR) repeat protein